MIACDLADSGKCGKEDEWYHIECLDINLDDVDKCSFLCEACCPALWAAKGTGVIRNGGGCKLVPAVLPDWKAAATAGPCVVCFMCVRVCGVLTSNAHRRGFRYAGNWRDQEAVLEPKLPPSYQQQC